MTPPARRETTAAELMAKLSGDAGFQAAAAERDAQRRRTVDAARAAEGPLRDDLRAVGLEVDTVWDLVARTTPYPEALPVLVAHLERGGYPDRVTEGIARALAVTPASPYWHRLRAVYLTSDGHGTSEGVAAALAASAQSHHTDDLIDLVHDDSRGESRIILLGALLRVGGDRGRDVVAALRADPVLGSEATGLLSQL